MIEINTYITPKSGVVVAFVENEYYNFWKKIKKKFQPYLPWLKEQNTGVPNDDLWYYWELFSFEKINCLKNEEAIQAFEEMKIHKCYIVQSPVWKNDGSARGFACCLQGEYDTSFINNDEEFYELKEDIKMKTPIPYWVIDCIGERVGRELYVFGEDLQWLLGLTHEKEIFFAKF